jgi:GNAT superfamily N-acetyltransferase
MIRDAVPGDAPEIARLSAQLGYPADAATYEERLRRLLPSPSHAILVCEADGGRLAGYVAIEERLMLVSSGRVEIVALVVDTEKRRAGTGRRLVEAAEDWARSRGGGELFLRSNIVRADAHAFYPALGYVHRKTQHAYAKRLY